MLALMERLARAMAILGGLVLTSLIVLVCLSVLGRGANTFGHWDWLEATAPELSEAVISTGIGPVTGDFELVEAGIAFAVFAFLPLCQLHGGHATVDIFTAQLPRKLNIWLIAFWEILLAAAILLNTWRLFAGMLGKMSNNEITFTLQFPVWWAYAASFAAACIVSVVSVYCAVGRVMQNLTGQKWLPEIGGVDH